MTSVTRQYSAVASQASQAVEKAADSWTQGVRRLAALVPAVPGRLRAADAAERLDDSRVVPVATSRVGQDDAARVIGKQRRVG